MTPFTYVEDFVVWRRISIAVNWFSSWPFTWCI